MRRAIAGGIIGRYFDHLAQKRPLRRLLRSDKRWDDGVGH
jgi:hypothetical protein